MRPTPKRPPAGPLAWNDAPGGPEQLARDYMAHQINQGLKVILPSTNEYQPGEIVRSIKGGIRPGGNGPASGDPAAVSSSARNHF